MGLVLLAVAVVYTLRGTAPDPGLRNATAIRTAEVEKEMQVECTKAFPLYGDDLTPKCWDHINELWDRGFTVNWNDQGEFRMELTQ